MAQYITRVELHSATDPDYEKLHAEMAKKGFSRMILAEDGGVYQLPSAEYLFEGITSLLGVFNLAQQATNEINKSAWINVNQNLATRFHLALTRAPLRR